MKKKAFRNLFLTLVILVPSYFVINKYFEKKSSAPATAGVALNEIPLATVGGRTLKLSDFRGRWVLVFFGYMTCPDVCPTTLAYLKNEYKNATASELPQLLFVSVDPKRDEPDRLDQFVKYFGPDFRAATGTEENLQLFAKKLNAYFGYEPIAGSSENYLVQHSSTLFLIDRQGKLFKAFTSPHTSGMISAAISNLAH